jgi:hypothetical protein
MQLLIQIVDVLIIIVALVAAPYMLAGLFRLPSPPSLAFIGRAIAPALLGALGLLWYVVKRGFAYGWQPEPHERPRWLRGNEVSSVSITSSSKNGADAQTDADRRYVSALYEATERLELDVSRRNIIDILVLAGADIPKIRSIIKGDNGAIGIEVAEARQRIGVEVPERTVTVRDNGGPPREIAL